MFAEPMTLLAPQPSARERPGLYRSRSHTDPSKSGTPAAAPETSGPKDSRATRPPHVRSTSYISPGESKQDAKPRNTHALAPAPSALEKTASRLHLPGSSHRHHKDKDRDKDKERALGHHRHSHSHSNLAEHSNDSTHSLSFRRHRPAQSEVHPPRRFASKETLSSLPHLVAGLNAERERERRSLQGLQHNPANPVTARHAGTSLMDVDSHHVHRHRHHPFGPSAAQANDFQPGGRYDHNSPDGFPELRRRATSDPSSRDNISRTVGAAQQPPLRPKTSIEELLEKGDAVRVARRIHVKKPDLLRKDQELQVGEEEMRSRVTELTATGVEITRRLDYGYYNLLEKVGSLVSMIGSFQSLAKQSETLISNFERESGRISEDTKRRTHNLRDGFDTRQVKAQQLAERGKRASDRATELSSRLEAARLKVIEWERREDKFRKAWDQVLGICWRTTLSVIILVVAVIVGKEWYFQGDPVKAGLGMHGEGNWNVSLRLGGGGDAEKLVLGNGSHDDTQATFNDRNAPNWDDRKPSVPDDVKKVLAGIAERNRQRKKTFPDQPPSILSSASGSSPDSNEVRGTWSQDQDQEECPSFKTLDEL